MTQEEQAAQAASAAAAGKTEEYVPLNVEDIQEKNDAPLMPEGLEKVPDVDNTDMDKIMADFNGTEKPTEPVIEKTEAEKAAELAASEQGKDKKDVVADEGEEFVLTPPVIDKTGEEEIESSWKVVAKEVYGKELEHDTFEDYQKLAKQELEAARNEGKNSADKISLETILPDEKAREIVKFVQEGGNIEDYLNPIKPFDDVLKSDDEALVRLDLEGKKWDDEKITQQIEILKEEGKLESTGYAIRKVVEQLKSQKEQEIISSQHNKSEQIKATIQKERQKEDNDIINSLSKRTEYLGGKITKESLDIIKDKWKGGEYRKLMANDPEAVVDFILNREFGAQAAEKLLKSGINKGKQSIQAKLHNIPDLSKGNQGRTEIRVPEKDNFDLAIEEFKKGGR